MIDALGAISDEEGRLTRLYLGPAHRRAADLVARWMREAGLDVAFDGLGTVRGRRDATAPRGHARLLIGSHIDSVVDAGRYDGALGVVCGILAAEEVQARRIEIPFGIDVLAFGDEEGVRFPATLVSSSAAAGILDPATLDLADRDGTTIAAALRGFGVDPAEIAAAAYEPGGVLGYFEVHIEQGPVLEHEGLPLGVVTSIAGQSRFRIRIEGLAGHAGTVPMGLRRDALAAAAEIMMTIETTARARDPGDAVVATVGSLAVVPGATNVIPGSVTMTLDLRAASDRPRAEVAEAIVKRAREIGTLRGVAVEIERYHEAPTCACAPDLQDVLAAAVDGMGLPPRRLASGAGHDGQAMARLTDIGMLFVRCAGGISHNPAEHVADEDMGLAVEALVRAVERLAAKAREGT